MKKLVSMLVPCYNGENFLDSCFKSILSQTYEKLEILFVNDGSTDNSAKIVNLYSEAIVQKGYSLKYFYQKNKGAAAAINLALKHVEGDYLILYDVDDILMPEAVSKKVKFLEEHTCYGMVRNNGYYIKKTEFREYKLSLFVNTIKEKKAEWIFELLIYGETNNWPGSYMVRTNYLFRHIKNKTIYSSHFGQNLQIMLPIAYHYKTGFLDEPLMFYRIHNKSHSHSKMNDYARRLELLNGYEKNRIEIIKTMDIEEKIKEQFTKNIKIKNYRNRMLLAGRKNDTKLMGEQYSLLKKNVMITSTIRFEYFFNRYTKIPCLIDIIKKYLRPYKIIIIFWKLKFFEKLFNKKIYYDSNS